MEFLYATLEILVSIPTFYNVIIVWVLSY